MTTEVSNLENVQELEVAVSGPDGADRLILCSGIVPIAQQADAGTVTQTWAWRVGPVLSRTQFRRAIAQGGLVRVSQTGAGASWSLIGIDAAWDGESGQVDVRAKIQVVAPGLDTSAGVQGISYQVSILAALAPEPGKAPAEPLSQPLPAVEDSGTGGGTERRSTERRSAESRGAEGRGAERRGVGASTPPPLQGAAQPLKGAPQPPPPTEPAEAAPAPPPPAEVKTPGPPEGTVLVEKIPTPPPPLPLQGAAHPTMAGEKVSPPPPPPPPPAAPAHAKASPPPPVLVLAPPVLDFGTVPVGGFRAKTVTISNTGSVGSGPLEMGFAGADASQFTLTVDPVASANLPPGASGHLLISFQPASPGPKTASLQIRTMTGAKVEATIVGTTP